jgi:hypothetical protein
VTTCSLALANHVTHRSAWQVSAGLVRSRHAAPPAGHDNQSASACDPVVPAGDGLLRGVLPVQNFGEGLPPPGDRFHRTPPDRHLDEACIGGGNVSSTTTAVPLTGWGSCTSQQPVCSEHVIKSGKAGPGKPPSRSTAASSASRPQDPARPGSRW